MSINRLLRQSVTISAAGSKDRHGKPTFGEPITTRARFEQKASSILTNQNERVPTDGIVFVLPTVSVTVGDKVVFEDETYRVMSSAKIPGRNGLTHHIELMVQRWVVA